MNEEPLVSVIIPTYYRNDLLAEAVDSVEKQNYSRVETIVVDDSGESHAEEILEGNNVIYIPLDENRGAQAARTTGIEAASGDIIQLLDDDDRLTQDKIQKQVNHLQSNPDIGVVYSGFSWNEGRVVLPNRSIQGNVLKYALTFTMAPCITSTMLIRAPILEKILPLKDRPGADDVGFKIELALETKFEFIDEPLIIRRDSEDSRGKSWGSYVGRKQILEDYSHIYAKRPKSELRRAKAYTELQRAEVELSESLWSASAITAAIRMCWYHPRPIFFSYLFCILFGQIGYKAGQKVYSSLLRDEVDRGKV